MLGSGFHQGWLGPTLCCRWAGGHLHVTLALAGTPSGYRRGACLPCPHQRFPEHQGRHSPTVVASLQATHITTNHVRFSWSVGQPHTPVRHL